MELILTRKTFTRNSTIGELTENGRLICYILEDFDRGLSFDMDLAEIAAIKIHGKTAIPVGGYQIIISYSNRFKKPLPLLLNVPGFTGIRIHSGNVEADSEGCLLPGTAHQTDMVLNSRAAFVPLASEIEMALEGGDVFITIQRG